MTGLRFDHFDLRVSDVAAARRFYDLFLPALGFAIVREDPPLVGYWQEGEKNASPFIELNPDPGHRGNANRFAFWTNSEEEVDRLGAVVRAAGACQVEGPAYCAEYPPGYYAVFFEDRDGNRWEVCCRNARVR